MERNFNLQTILDNIKTVILKISSKPEFIDKSSIPYYNEQNIMFGSINNENIPSDSKFIYINQMSKSDYDISNTTTYNAPVKIIGEEDNYNLTQVESVYNIEIQIGSQTNDNMSFVFGSFLESIIRNSYFAGKYFYPLGVPSSIRSRQYANQMYDRKLQIPVFEISFMLRFCINNLTKSNRYNYHKVDLYQVNQTIGLNNE